MIVASFVCSGLLITKWCSVVFLFYIHCLSSFFCVVIAACRLPGQPEAMAALPTKLCMWVTHVPMPVLCQLIRTPFPFRIVLPRRGLIHQGRCPLWTLPTFQPVSFSCPPMQCAEGVSCRNRPSACGIETTTGEPCAVRECWGRT